MLLTVDMGNTNISIGAYKDKELLYEARLCSTRQRTSDQFAIELLDIFRLYQTKAADYDGAIICSVVPELTNIMVSAIRKSIGKEPLLLNSSTDTGLAYAVSDPKQVGSDLVAASVGATAKYAMPCLICDLGTATKIIVLNAQGAFCGCTISPGIGISLDALAATASQLPHISFSAPEHTVGTDTVACMQSGIVYGTAAMLDGLTDRICDEMGYDECTIVVTGGYGRRIQPYCKRTMVMDATLVSDGLAHIYERITKTDEN